MNTAFDIVTIQLNKLVACPQNIRKTGGQGVEDLAASIQAHGLLRNLIVIEKGKQIPSDCRRPSLCRTYETCQGEGYPKNVWRTLPRY